MSFQRSLTHDIHYTPTSQSPHHCHYEYTSHIFSTMPQVCQVHTHKSIHEHHKRKQDTITWIGHRTPTGWASGAETDTPCTSQVNRLHEPIIQLSVYHNNTTTLIFWSPVVTLDIQPSNRTKYTTHSSKPSSYDPITVPPLPLYHCSPHIPHHLCIHISVLDSRYQFSVISQ